MKMMGDDDSDNMLRYQAMMDDDVDEDDDDSDHRLRYQTMMDYIDKPISLR